MPKASPVPALIDRRLIRAVSNPTRVDILNLLVEKGPSSPSKIAKRLDHVSVNLVSHHIKVLRELGCVELIDEVRHGGRTERIYQARKRHFFSAPEWEAMDPRESNPITLDILRMISEDIETALLADSFDQIRNNHLSRIPLCLDREGWEQVVSILLRALEEVEEAGKRSLERSRASGEQMLEVRVALMQFLMPGERDERGHLDPA